jgi:transposase
VRWPLQDGVTNGDLQQTLFPDKASATLRKCPDYEQVHRELAKSGVTLSLLWHEYCEECHPVG